MNDIETLLCCIPIALLWFGPAYFRRRQEDRLILRRLENENLPVSVLVEYLRDSNTKIRRVALERLRKAKYKSAIPTLIEVLRRPDVRSARFATEVREAVIEALVEIGPDATFALVEVVRNPGRWAILTQQHQQIRAMSANALFIIADESAIPVLREAMRDEDRQVRDLAKVLLVKLGDEQIIQDLFEALRNKDECDRAAEMLVYVGEGAIPDLLEALHAPEPEVRSAAVGALAKIQQVSAVHTLLNTILDPHWRVRWQSAIWLGEVGDEHAVPVLEKAQTDERYEVRLSAKKALKKIAARRKLTGER